MGNCNLKKDSIYGKSSPVKPNAPAVEGIIKIR